MWRTLRMLLMVVVLAAGLAAPALAEFRTHVVAPGENLYRIALKYGVGVEELMRANGLLDPNRLRVGQVLVIPAPGPQDAGPISVATYVVQRGDTLYGIAKRAGVTVRALMDANGLATEAIYVGQRLTVPRPAPAAGAVLAPVNPPLLVGATIPAPRPLRIRRGPRMYDTVVALVAPDTPLTIQTHLMGWFSVSLPGGEVGWVRELDLASPAGGPGRLPETLRAIGPAQIVTEAMRYLGTRYVWGGESERGVDCSGFVYVVLSAYVPNLPRLSSFDYYTMGAAVGRNDLLPGDLVFFTTYAPGPSHVGIYLGDGRFIHASSSRARVIITPLSDAYYAARYVGARRLTRP